MAADLICATAWEATIPRTFTPVSSHTIAVLGNDLLTLDGKVNGPRFASFLNYGPGTIWLALRETVVASVGSEDCLRLDAGIGYTVDEVFGFQKPWVITAIADADTSLSLVWGRRDQD